MKRLIVNYKNDKAEYRMPVLCTAEDIGKIIYGKWIIGGECGQLFFENNCCCMRALSEEELKEQRFYIAYKLTDGSFIQCNFELDTSQSPYIQFYGFDNWIEKTGDRGYNVDGLIDNYASQEPDYDYHSSGLRYIKMPEQKEKDNRKEKIEKMAKDLDEHCSAFVCGYAQELPTKEFAERLYEAGYGKVREALEDFEEEIIENMAESETANAIKIAFRKFYKEFWEK